MKFAKYNTWVDTVEFGAPKAATSGRDIYISDSEVALLKSELSFEYETPSFDRSQDDFLYARLQGHAAMIGKYGFIVSRAGKSFVVRHADRTFVFATMKDVISFLRDQGFNLSIEV